MRSSWLGLVGVVSLLGSMPASAAFSKAEPKGAAKVECKNGSFPDPRNGGECWSCPKGFDRTVFYPVDGSRACLKPAVTTFKEATFKRAEGCNEKDGEFFDPRKGGQCWKCPTDRPRRTAYSVTDDRACATKEIVGEKLAPAKYKHKSKGCSGSQFYDPRNGGECWACPKGYRRTVEAVTSKKACEKVVDDYEKATKVSSTCPPGAFFDPNGKCYECPKSAPLRSIHPVTGDKACATTLTDAFVPDVALVKQGCGELVDALKAALDTGKAAQDKLNAVVKPLLDPIRKPLEAAVGDAIEQVSNKTNVDELVNEIVDPLDDYADDALDFAKTASAKKEKLQAMLLDKNIICSGDVPKMITELKNRLGTAASKHFVSISLIASFKHPLYVPRVNLGITFATNLSKKGGLYTSIGLGANASIGVAGLKDDPSPLIVAFAATFHPRAKLADFGLSPIPSMGFGLGKGGAWDKAEKKFPPLSALSGIDAFEISWDFDVDHYPALGVSKELFSAVPATKGIFAVSGGVGWGIPVFVYDN